jgi:hypothetical protein
MQHEASAPVERRVTGRWDRLSNLTGISMGGRQTGWDRLAAAIMDDPAIRLKAVCRLEAIVNLCRMLTRLSETHFVVLALRYGLSVDDETIDARPRREVSERINLSVSRVAQLESEAVEDLRRRIPIEFPRFTSFVYHATRQSSGNGTEPGNHL